MSNAAEDEHATIFAVWLNGKRSNCPSQVGQAPDHYLGQAAQESWLETPSDKWRHANQKVVTQGGLDNLGTKAAFLHGAGQEEHHPPSGQQHAGEEHLLVRGVHTSLLDRWVIALAKWATSLAISTQCFLFEVEADCFYAGKSPLSDITELQLLYVEKGPLMISLVAVDIESIIGTDSNIVSKQCVLYEVGDYCFIEWILTKRVVIAVDVYGIIALQVTRAGRAGHSERLLFSMPSECIVRMCAYPYTHHRQVASNHFRSLILRHTVMASGQFPMLWKFRSFRVVCFLQWQVAI